MSQGKKRVPMDWRQSEEETTELKRVLQKSGVPLETRTLNAVRTFCAEHSSTGLQAVDLGPALWRSLSTDAYREIDAAALLQQRMTVGSGHVKVTILAYVFFEAKYREDVEWFSFASPHSARLPATSNAAFSESITDIYIRAAQSLPISRLATLKTGNENGCRDETVPYKEEKLAQNAAGALANLLRHSTSDTSTLMPVPSLNADTKSDILERFERRFGAGSASKLRTFLKDLSVEEHQAFLNGTPEIPAVVVCVYIPVMVVNGRMNTVSMDDDGTIRDIAPSDYAVTGERLPNWPPEEPFVSPSAHFPLVIASADGLPSALQMVYEYVGNLRDAYFDAATRDDLNAVAFESAVATVVNAWMREPRF